MVKFMCSNCNKIFDKKSSYLTHINRKIPCEYVQLKITVADINKYIHKLTCIICGKKFATMPNAKRHIRKYCENVQIIDNNNDDNIKEHDMENIIGQLVDNPNYGKLLDNLVARIGGVKNFNKNKINNTTINNNTNNNTKNTNNTANINVNINNTIIHPYGDEIKNGFHISENEWIKIINKGFLSPIELIMFMHFNEKLPQFQNIYLPHLEKKFIKYFNGSKWITNDKKEILPQLLTTKVELINDKYEEFKNNVVLNKYIQARMHNVMPNLVDAVYDDNDPRIIEMTHNAEFTLFNNKDVPINAAKIMNKK